MNLHDHFGDSYDIVKRALLGWLAELGAWQAHPMFTSQDTSKEAATAFERLLGVPLLSREVITTRTNREEYFAVCKQATNLLLDPDTGVSLKAGRPSPARVSAIELESFARQRPTRLTLTFDQSFARGNAIADIKRELAHFRERELAAFYYQSHASFLLVSLNASLVDRARVHLIKKVGLPSKRIIDHKRPHER